MEVSNNLENVSGARDVQNVSTCSKFEVLSRDDIREFPRGELFQSFQNFQNRFWVRLVSFSHENNLKFEKIWEIFRNFQ